MQIVWVLIYTPYYYCWPLSPGHFFFFIHSLYPCPMQSVQSPVKSTKVVPASPQKANIPTVTPRKASALSSPVASPQKGLNKGTTSQSPLKSQGLSRHLDLNAANASPSKLDLPAKPARSDPSIPSRETPGVGSATPQQQKATSGTPGKIFLNNILPYFWQ